MPIVSISLSDEDLQALNQLQTEGGFTNRSDLLRRALRTLASETQELDKLSGETSAVLTIVYGKKGKGIESNFLLHRQAQLIDALLHSHTVNGECIEVIVVNGPANDVRKLIKILKGNRKIHTIKVAIIGGENT
ncbi:MAG: CopG family ribbon-helix-helix protein [Candidatus Hermodarchaeota archaeon]